MQISGMEIFSAVQKCRANLFQVGIGKGADAMKNGCENQDLKELFIIDY
jgi:hypothetical protein